MSSFHDILAEVQPVVITNTDTTTHGTPALIAAIPMALRFALSYEVPLRHNVRRDKVRDGLGFGIGPNGGERWGRLDEDNYHGP